MIIRKKTILAVAVMVMLAGSNSSIFACTDTEGKCGDFTAFTNSQVEKAMADMNIALAEMNKSLAKMKNVHIITINTKAEAESAKTSAEAIKAKAEAEAAKAKAEAEAAKAKALAEASKAQAKAFDVKEAMKPVVPVVTTKPAVPVVTTKPLVPVVTTKPAVPAVTTKPTVLSATTKPAAPAETPKPTVQVETPKPATQTPQVEAVKQEVQIDTVKAAAELAAKASVEAAMGQGYYGTNLNVSITDSSTYVIDPDNGDEIATTVDPETKVTNIVIKRPRKDAPDNYIQTSSTETAALIIADGDIFNCDVGFYGNSISPVSLAPEYKSSYKIELKNSSVMTGEINNNNKIQNVLLTMDKTSKWIVKGTSYISVLEDEDNTLSNIVDNGNTIYYDASIESNNWLGGKTYKLSGGGVLTPKN